MLRGRIVALKGVPVEQVSAAPNAQWVIRGGRNMTYADELPENSELVRGTWWAKGYQGPPLVSIVDDIADGLGVTIGDEMTINVLGRDITARIANTRSVEWDSLQINFVLVLSANALAAAPHTDLATVTMDSAGELDLLRRVSDALPNVTAVRIKEILDAVNGLMGKLLLAVRGASGLTLLAGALVLAGAMAAGHRARLYDAVVLKAIGATRGGLMASYGFEYAILGATTAVFAAFAGTLGSYFVVSYAMTLDWVFAPAATVWTVAVATVATVVLGLAGTWRVLGEKAAPVLRSRS
jgi:putative ABC transport system permease protein